MTKCVVETHDLVVLSEETLPQGKYVELLLTGVNENLPPPVSQVFHKVFVKGAFARELQREMKKPVNVCIYPSPLYLLEEKKKRL